jgi:hypothetical protein
MSVSLNYDDLVVLEKKYYPTKEEAVATLIHVYKDKYPIPVGETAHEWYYRFVWPKHIKSYTDPNVAENLLETFNLNLAHIPYYRVLVEWNKNGALFLRTFNHMWTLWAWSKWLEKKSRYNVGRPLIIHLDSHDDLEVPSLICTTKRGKFKAPIGEQILHLYQSTTVPPFVLRGFIGIGGFIIPFLHTIQECDLVHIYPQSNTSTSQSSMTIELIAEQVQFFKNLKPRPSVTFQDSLQALQHNVRYLLTDDLSILRRLNPQGAVLLDLDLDFFCNRFDNQEDHTDKTELSLEQVCQLIDHFGSYLQESSLLKHVEVVTLAISPGFFPSAYWATTIPRLETMLQKLFNGDN